MFQAMSKRFIAVALVYSAGLAGCASPYEVYLDGQIYDGATGARLTDYEMVIEYRDVKVKAEVSDTGRFVTHVPVFQDYTVAITASGYRAFRSHNPAFNVPNPNAELASAQGSQTFYFDAYLFPDNLAAPAITLNVRKGTSTGELASGKVRIRPVSASSIADTEAELPAGVRSQVWTNDEDLQAKPILRDLSGGPLVLEGKELIYGVRYMVNVYDVPGFQPFEGSIVAGVDNSKTVLLAEEASEPLALLNTNADECVVNAADTATAMIKFEFNSDIELAATTLVGGYAEAVDNAFTISSPDANVNGMLNVLRLGQGAPQEQERGTRIQIVKNVLTVSWNPRLGLMSSDTDPITAYWNLSSVMVQQVGKPQPKSLASLALTSQFICQ